ncbi:MAG TPA: DNA repair protein RadA [bacterium]|nr:DNA repair protein RadA [bacterium]
MTAKKARVAFFCSDCGATAPGWLGRCPGCGKFNTMVEAPAAAAPHRARAAERPAARALTLSQIPADQLDRWDTGFGELNRVLGGGLVPGSLVLIGGSPGIGKSTLLLQAAAALAGRGKQVLYATGEESAGQLALRARRLGIADPRLRVIAESDLAQIFSAADGCELLVLDSIQAVFHPDVPALPGTVSQIRECTAQLVDWAKPRNTAVFIVGHVTKEGALAGPRLLEHMVDTVLYFDSDQQLFHRIIRAVKNRFGATNELGIFRMVEGGLEEVSNPSDLFINQRPEPIAGTAVAAVMSGSRPLLCEVQALGVPTVFGNPRRVASGIDYNRLLMILAVLERRAGIPVSTRDIYVSVTGGLRVSDDPGADLAVALAVVSHLRDRPLPVGLAAIGELALSGEILPVLGGETRLRESAKLGYTRAVGPARHMGDKHPLPYAGAYNLHAALAAAELLTKGGTDA